VTKKRLDDYDSEMHKTIPKILGYLSTVGTINTDVREQLQPLVDEILALDVEVAKGGLFIDRDRGLMVQELADCYEKMVEVERLLPERIGSIVRERSVRYPGAATSGRKIPRS